jgi:two-component system LytT family sensor kinase
VNALYEVTNTLLVWQAVGCLIGLCVSFLLIQLVRASWSNEPQRRPGILLSVAMLVWNLGGLLNALLIVVGFDYLSIPAKVACAFGYSGLTVLTWAALSVWKLSTVGKWRKRTAGGLEVLAVTLGILTTFWLWMDAVASNAPLSRTAIRVLAEATLYALVSMAVVLALSHRPAWTTRLCAGLMGFGTLGPVIALLLVPTFSRLPQELRVGLSVYAEQSVNYVAVAAFILLARLHYTDVLVERALRCSLAILGGVGIWYSFESIVRNLPDGGHSRAAFALTASVAIASFALLVPLLNSAIRSLTSRIFQTPDFDAKLQELSISFRGTDKEEDALAITQSFLLRLLEFRDTQIIPADSLSSELTRSLSRDGILEYPPGSAALGLADSDADAIVPVSQNMYLTHAIVLTRSPEQRALLASEASFLRKLAGMLAGRLAAIRAEREKMDQQQREALLRHETVEAELRALRAQLNPHFLFNALNTIADLIAVDADKAERMTEKLAEVFRSVLANSQRTMISVREEIEFVSKYLEIEKARFRDRLQVRIDVEPGLGEIDVPAMILQPLVENAIKHGLAPKMEPGILSISVRQANRCLLLTVEDDGMGPRSPRPDRCQPLSNGNRRTASTGLGLANTSRRLHTLYGESAELVMDWPEPQGCRVTIRIPDATDARTDR